MYMLKYNYKLRKKKLDIIYKINYRLGSLGYYKSTMDHIKSKKTNYNIKFKKTNNYIKFKRSNNKIKFKRINNRTKFKKINNNAYLVKKKLILRIKRNALNR